MGRSVALVVLPSGHHFFFWCQCGCVVRFLQWFLGEPRGFNLYLNHLLEILPCKCIMRGLTSRRGLKDAKQQGFGIWAVIETKTAALSHLVFQHLLQCPQFQWGREMTCFPRKMVAIWPSGWQPCPWQRMIFKVPTNLSHSMTVWFYYFLFCSLALVPFSSIAPCTMVAREKLKLY